MDKKTHELKYSIKITSNKRHKNYCDIEVTFHEFPDRLRGIDRRKDHNGNENRAESIANLHIGGSAMIFLPGDSNHPLPDKDTIRALFKEEEARTKANEINEAVKTWYNKNKYKNK
tara:strand:- start:22581 stop:22928 length:348 start_codon:yes stop_codon:yes gene_type:complete